jgi:uncharacterized damage-inducible protein DinB
MSRTLIDDAFAHHTWATIRLIDACAALTLAQLETAVAGTYGSILGTLRHLVGSDSFDLLVARGTVMPPVAARDADLAELRAAMDRNGREWSLLLAADPDPATVLREVDPGDGFQRDAPLAIRLAQALHHGSEHRSQVCTALTILGVKPPAISAFDFGLAAGLTAEVMPGA